MTARVPHESIEAARARLADLHDAKTIGWDEVKARRAARRAGKT